MDAVQAEFPSLFLRLQQVWPGLNAYPLVLYLLLPVFLLGRPGEENLRGRIHNRRPDGKCIDIGNLSVQRGACQVPDLMAVRHGSSQGAHEEFRFIHAPIVSTHRVGCVIDGAVQETDVRMFNGGPQRLGQLGRSDRENHIFLIGSGSLYRPADLLIMAAVVKADSLHQSFEAFLQGRPPEFVAVVPGRFLRRPVIQECRP